ncbi:MAG: glycosyl hydrolase 53 family protein [Lachnospiraceae bacterium]|nr:glycosyl hydrolase 53 family protein [Lachnospiraceae bacterium]
MKKIALITDGWRRYVTYAWVIGITQRARQLGVDICLYTFNTNGNLSHDEKFNEGEYSLYDQIDFSVFDGIVFDCTNTEDPDIIAATVEKLKASNVPVVSISYYVEGFHYVGNDNKNLIRSMVKHMYEVHGCRNMVFAGGPEHNYENIQRFEAFCETLPELGLPVSEGSYMFGDYDCDTGIRYFHEWTEAGKVLPDVFICANDNIAAGICKEAIRQGYEVPKDFRVTGFDNLDKAAYYKPQIASVNHNRGTLGNRAFDILNALMNHEKTDIYTYMHSDIVPAETCGCPNTGLVDYRDYAKWQIDDRAERDRHEEYILELEKHFAECRNIAGLFESFAGFIRNLDCSGLFICVDKALIEAMPESRFSEDVLDQRSLVVVAAEDHGKRLYSVRNIGDVRKYLSSAEKPRDYMFFPIHFRNQRVGTTILLEPDFLYDYPLFYDAHHAFIDRLQNLFVQTQLENAAARMKGLYNRDVLTGLYNRITYNEMIVPKFDVYRKEGIVCAMCFFDVDHFKKINDTFGHDFGDRVLITIASAINAYKPGDSYAYRFGGDEFVVFIPYATEEKVDRFIKRVHDELISRYIEVSSGVIYTDPESSRTSDEYLVIADKHMYEVKRARKSDLGEKPDVDRPFVKPHFLKGADISSVPEKEEKGFIFKDIDGTETDPLELLEKYGINSVRLRIWNDPRKVPEAGGYCDLARTIAMARRIKERNMHFLLDFHYSDHWADPGQQRKPAAWENLNFEDLRKAVYDYTHYVLSELSKNDALPDMVQIGNEVRSGILFPDGAVPNYQALAKLINSGIRAVRDISESIRVMIHLDQGGRFFCLREWLDAMFAAGLKKIDAIGLSFYSFWHGTFKDLKESMAQLIDRYDLPVYIVETAHPWRHCELEHVNSDMMKMAGFPAGIEEQKKALSLMMQIAAEVSGKRDTGSYYWEPLCITDHGLGSWDENMGMMDTEGKVLPSILAFKDFDPLHPMIPNLDKYIASLYTKKTEDLPSAGMNLIPDGCFLGANSGWWVTKYPETVEVAEENEELRFSCLSNFSFEICRDIRIDKPGKYRLSIEYRGTNTTGVKVKLYFKRITCNDEILCEKNIYPSDIDFELTSLDMEISEAGNARVGLKVDAPPVTGRIRDFRLVEIF